MARKILVNAFSAKVGGGKTYVANLLQHLPNEDFKLYIYLPEDMSIPDDPRLIRLRTSWPTHNPFLRSLWEIFILPRTIKKLGVGLLFCPGGVYSTRHSPHFKILTMFRNMLPFDPRILSSGSGVEKARDFLKKRMMLKSMARADEVIFISDYARKVIENLITVKKSITIPHGISKQFYAYGKNLSRPSLPFDGKYILYVSRFEFYKRHLEVVKAYQLLSENIRAEYKLLLVGGTDLSYGQEVLNYVHQNKLQNVVILGHYPYLELPSLYSNASLIVFASACENCPNILLESLGAGQPVLSSNYEPMPEFGGEAVDYMNPDSPSEMAAQIQKNLAQNPAEKRELLRKQADKFSWEVTAQKTWNVLLGL